VLAQFGGREGEAKAACQRFVVQGLVHGRRPELMGGGLVLSLGGRGEVRSRRQRKARTVSDERILGSGHFVEKILREAQARTQRQHAAWTRSGRAEQVIVQTCKRNGVSLTELRAGSRLGKLPELRADLACRLVDDFGLPVAKVARELGISTSGVSKILSWRLSS
jgi:putative transposase